MASPIQIPGIELGDELGRGAYSVVYRGRQGTTPCAVKLPLVRGRWTRWVYREAVALARVHHPNLPAVLEVGEIDDLPFIVMELVDGETLADRLRRGTLSLSETLDLAVQLVGALGAVHSVGLVHRDVKPRNIAFSRDETARLIDFGFATPAELGSQRERAGTQGYAAPEQFRINARVDGRTDLYAVGKVLVECLADRSIRALASSDISPASLTEQGRPFAPILLGLLAEAPEDRYPDASALLRDLELIKRGRPALGHAAYTAERQGTAVIGRSPQLHRLNRGWLNLRTTGSVLILRGARGGGKTRLLTACATAARDSGACRVVNVACHDGDPPLATLRRLFNGCCMSMLAGSSTERAEGEQKLRLAVSGHLQPFARLLAPELADSMGLGLVVAEAAPGGFAEGAAELLVRLARSAGPLFMCVDDAQWIDPVSRDAILRLSERVDDTPVALVLALRTGPITHAIEQLLADAHSRSAVVDLEPLDEADTRALIASYLAATELPPSLARRVAAIADGTPLGVLEVLGAFLDSGALRPHATGWELDPVRAERVVLPEGALVLLGRRVAELPPATQRVLEVAALIGTTFDQDLLARVVELGVADLEYAFSDAQQAGVVERDESGHRLVHDSLREMLVGAIPDATRRALHQRLAELIDLGDGSSFETLCSCARHYAAGQTRKTPARAYRVARLAAEAALARFDNETALHFFDLALEAVNAGDLTLDSAFYRSRGEAHLRLGALTDSLDAFDSALEHASDGEARAAILGRIAWVEQARADPKRAWIALGDAFLALGAAMPVDSATSAAHTVARLARTEIRKRTTRGREGSRTWIALLCDLHYQNARLGMEYGKPLRFAQSTLEAVTLGDMLGPSRARAQGRATYGVILSTLGRGRAGAREIAGAQRMALELGDTITQAFCIQLQGVAACFAGDFGQSLELLAECVDSYGPWLELNEYCLDASTGDYIESLRGRPLEALAWSARIVDRDRRNCRASPVSIECLVHRRRAALASLGQSESADPWLSSHDGTPPSPPGSLYRLFSWGPRARFLLETDTLGEEFEALVRAFEAEKHNPRSVHPMVAEYYIVVAHARLQQCLRAPEDARKPHIARLRRALSDLRLSAKVPPYKAHCLFIEGSYAWLSGASADARGFFVRAGALAEEQSSPWVLSAIARVRAHMSRQEGKPDAARDHARVSEMLATQYGAEPHARWVREEFSLVAAERARPSVASSAQTSSRLRRQLSSLLNVARGPSVNVQPSDQAARIIDDLLHDLDAERGVLWFHADPGVREALVVGRTARGGNWVTPAPLDHVTHPPSDRTLNVPLFLYERVVGGVRLERQDGTPPFGASDHELLIVLSHQIPVTFEIGRLLVEREQLQTSLQQAQKMDAIGQLAGGVAHDFNNMLAAIRGSLHFLEHHTRLDGEATAEVATISSAMQRAVQLTGQLLSFSRHQPVPLAGCQINDVLGDLLPILRRLLSDGVVLEVTLDPALHVAETARQAFDQAIVNLVVNARDAMPSGGTLTIRTRNAVLDAGAVRRGAPEVGDYVVVEVADTGRGMTADVAARVFDPFFTTKPNGAGTGFGLTTVYAFVKKCRGHIEVMSDIEGGTTFSVYLPKSTLPRESVNAPLAVVSVVPGPTTVLVVDDDFGVRSTIEKVLRRAGYRVLVAGESVEAIDLVGRHRSEIALVILDMVMPGMTGPELARRLVELELRAPMLFVSGFAPESFHADQAERAEFLQKPFEIPELLSRVRRLVGTA